MRPRLFQRILARLFDFAPRSALFFAATARKVRPDEAVFPLDPRAVVFLASVAFRVTPCLDAGFGVFRAEAVAVVDFA
ncbi:MAG TPA: hypothetical protein VF057_00985, partial [Thermoanaerobaculia bacterium]